MLLLESGDLQLSELLLMADLVMDLFWDLELVEFLVSLPSYAETGSVEL